MKSHLSTVFKRDLTAPLGNISHFWIKSSYEKLETVISKESRQACHVHVTLKKKKPRGSDKAYFKKNEFVVQFYRKNNRDASFDGKK